VEGSPLRAEVIRLARSAVRLGQATPLVEGLVRSQVERAAHLMDQVATRSEATYDGEDRDWLLALTYHAKSTLDATSRGSRGPDGRFVDEGLWRTELGRRYLEAQSRAIRNGVAIRRVFILDQAELAKDPAFREICEEQSELGIQVRVVAVPMARGAGVTFVSDFILFDDEVSYESTPSLSNLRRGEPMFVGTALVLDSVRIAQQRQRFDDLWAAPDARG
jgi:hypothetical protein